MEVSSQEELLQMAQRHWDCGSISVIPRNHMLGEGKDLKARI